MANTKSGSPQVMEDNLKKAATEMLILLLLAEEDMYAFQITQMMEARSNGAVSIQFPYSALYRLIDGGYIIEAYKKTSPDGRRRQYFQITEAGRAYAKALREVYLKFTDGIKLILKGESRHEKRGNVAISPRIEKNSALPPQREGKTPLPRRDLVEQFSE